MENDPVAGAPPASRPRRSLRLGRLTLRLAAWALLLVFALACAGAVYQAVATWRDARKYHRPGVLVKVDGRALHALARGAGGGPTVVFESPLGGSLLSWCLVQPQVAQFAPTVAYDRAGYGWSEGASGLRTAADAANDLRALLHVSGTAAPYVLVGNSFGGLLVRLYALRAPGEVAGLVLVDPVHEKMFERLPSAAEEVRGFQRTVLLFRVAARTGLLRVMGVTLGEGSSDILPDALRPAARAAGFRTAWADAIGAEAQGLPASFSQVRAALAGRASPLGDLPLVVLTRGKPANPGPGEAAEWEALTDLHAALARESSVGRHRIVEGTGHMIQADKPEAVVAAVREVLNALGQPVTKP